MRITAQRMAAMGVAAVVVATLAAAIVVLDPPRVQRERKLDDRRVGDLMQLSGLVNAYFDVNKRLPPNLAMLAQDQAARNRLVDPVSAKPYEYAVEEGNRYRLCADFTGESGSDTYYMAEWAHAPGHKCFTRTPRR